MEKFEERLTALENKFGSNDFGKKEKKEGTRSWMLLH